jgi:hypothetical protein
MSFYADIAATALELLDEFGVTVILKREAGGSVNPITGQEFAGVDASVTTTGIIKSYKDEAVDGTRVLSSDRELVLSNEEAPSLSDRILINNQNWSVVNINTLSPAGVPIVYFCQVRR